MNKPHFHLIVLWACVTNHVAVSFTAQPGLSVSLAKARQRGWAVKHSAQWHMLCGFLGTSWRTVVLLCQASLYCRGPLGCSSPNHSRGWKGISLDSNWKDATLNSADASIPHSCAVVAEMLTVAMVEAGLLSWDKSLGRTTLSLTVYKSPRGWGWALEDNKWLAAWLQGYLFNSLKQWASKHQTWLVRVMAPTIIVLNHKDSTWHPWIQLRVKTHSFSNPPIPIRPAFRFPKLWATEGEIKIGYVRRKCSFTSRATFLPRGILMLTFMAHRSTGIRYY